MVTGNTALQVLTDTVTVLSAPTSSVATANAAEPPLGISMMSVSV
jgi:hypothetical protein